MASRKPSSAGEIVLATPNPHSDNTVSTPPGDQRIEPSFLAGKNNQYPTPVAFDDTGPLEDPEVFLQEP